MIKSSFFLLLLLLPVSVFAQLIQKPRGCFAGTNGTNAAVLSHANARGVLLTEKWSNIEPTPGVYDFTNLNNKINTVKAAGLKYTLAIGGGAFGSPDWLIDTLNVAYHNFTYQSQNLKLPLWWDTICMQRMTSMITELGNQYAADSMLSHVYVTQMTVNGIEGHLNGVNIPTFITDGFTNQKWIAAAKTTTHAFANAFPDKPIVFEVHEIDHDTTIAATIINDLTNDPSLCKRVGLGMWWISGKITYQPNLIDLILNFQGDKYAQIIGRSDQIERFKDSLYSNVFTQAKHLGIRYLEPWPYEFQYNTYDSLIQDFNTWADANFSATDTCSAPNANNDIELQNKNIILYPNPTNGMVNFKIDFLYQIFEASLYDVHGQKLWQASKPTSLNLSQFTPGTYIVKLKIDNVKHYQKLIKFD